MKKEEIIESIKKIEKISNEIIQTKEKIKDEELEKYFCKLEKVRMDMYDAVMQENLWRDFMGDEVTDFIDYDYKAKNEKYKKLSIEAKVIYSFLLNRMNLSRMNKWINDKGEIYLIYTRKEIQIKLFKTR